MSDGVPRTPDVSQPDIVASVEELSGQDCFIFLNALLVEIGFIASPAIEPIVSILGEAMEKENDTLGPLVFDLLLLAYAN